MAILLRLLRWYRRRIAGGSMPWHARLPSAFGGAAVFAGTAVLLAEERLQGNWSDEPHARDGTALLSQADTIVGAGPAFAVSIILAPALVIAGIVSTSVEKGGALHLFLMGFGASALCVFAVNVALTVAGAAAG